MVVTCSTAQFRQQAATWCPHKTCCCGTAGKLDTFFVQAPDVGAISSIQLQCLGGGLTAAWHLDSVTVTHSVRGQVAWFLYNDWFDKSKGWVQVGGQAEVKYWWLTTTCTGLT
jgi:hypothetical protein